MTGNKKYYKLRSGDPTTWKLEIFYTDIFEIDQKRKIPIKLSLYLEVINYLISNNVLK